MWSKWRKFASLGRRQQQLLAEALLSLGWARIMKALPFSRVAPGLGAHMEETGTQPNPSQVPSLKQVAYAVNLMSRHTWWESKCLVKAMAAMRMLERRGISCTLYMGMAREETGQLLAHAWLRSGPYYITGAEEKDRYTCVATFARHVEG
ncbi:lasso peptide biosynthesis B2 protein [Paenibacillus sp. SYP-B4298]|uniref:lasso peptide biosynthesis B2 protein n=1 Tax=Paenibacillus sp. SYP-B4298 TaxID=2996034 RepID=UPI0022DD6A87|nr:lasso peptide biosynthesis B2 protein [Paenibacillus sp. SYP-B4298]